MIRSALLILLVTAGCNKKPDHKTDEPAKPEAPATTGEPAEPRPEVSAHMKEHFTRVSAIRDAVIAGDYAATREPSTWLAEHGAPQGIPDDWIELVTDLRKMAGGLEEATDVEQVALALGPVARACGSCHEKLGAEIKYQPPAAPAGDGFKAEMDRHRWAAGLLWDGVVIPNDAAWTAGAGHFAATALVPEKPTPELEKLAAEVKQLGEKAASAADRQSRGNVYGELLASCATCHQLAGVKPK